MNSERYLRRPDAAKYAGVSISKLDRMIASGKLPAIKDGGVVLVDRHDIDTTWERLKTASPQLPAA